MPDRMTDARLEQLRNSGGGYGAGMECVREIDRLRSELADARAVMDRLFREVRGNDDCEDDCIAESCPWMAASDWLGRQSAAQEKEGGDAKRGTGNGTGMSET